MVQDFTDRGISHGLEDVFFRAEENFHSGIYSDFVEISMIYANRLSSDFMKHKAYSIIHEGTDIFDNIAPID